jgi:hypothetical protein
MNTMKKHIMRRVYYAYALKAVLHPRTVHVLVGVVLWSLLTTFVSVGDVLYNLSLMKVYDIDAFVLSAFQHTEAWTLITLAAFVVLIGSYVRSMRMYRPHMPFTFA